MNEMTNPRFKVNEIFFSIQGEGRGPLHDRKAQPQREWEHRARRDAIGAVVPGAGEQ